MAMIKCPECGQEISDKAKKCIHCGTVLVEEKTKICSECGKEVPIDVMECSYCGYPFEEQNIEEVSPIVNDRVVTKQKTNILKIIVPIAVVVVVLTIGILIYNVKVVKPKNTYNNAIVLLEKGKYDEANELFNTIKGYSDVDTIAEQLKYESYAYSAINSLKKHLKNPDSYQPYEITFYASMGTKDDSSSSSESQIAEDAQVTEEADITDDKGDSEVVEKLPACIMHYGAQNGFGGNTTGYALFNYSTEDGEYTLIGTCDSLDKEDYDSDDEDELYELLICSLINLYRDGEDTVGNIDLARLKTVLKNDAYSTIKIIE